MTQATKHEGVSVSMGGKAWVVPALSFGQLKRLGPKIASLSAVKGVPTDAQMDVVCEIVQAALLRNYPEIQLAEIEEMIDLRNAESVILAVMGAAGLESRPGEAAAVS